MGAVREQEFFRRARNERPERSSFSRNARKRRPREKGAEILMALEKGKRKATRRDRPPGELAETIRGKTAWSATSGCPESPVGRMNHQEERRLRGIGESSGSVPPRRASRRAVSRWMSAESPSLTRADLSLMPLNSFAFSRSSSSIVTVILIASRFSLGFHDFLHHLGVHPPREVVYLGLAIGRSVRS